MRTLRDALGDLPEPTFADLLEREDAYLLVVDVPGATQETTAVEVAGRALRVTAERPVEVPDGFELRRRRRDRTIELELPLPPDVDADGAEAAVERGVLELTLPRTDGGPTTIPIE